MRVCKGGIRDVTPSCVILVMAVIILTTLEMQARRERRVRKMIPPTFFASTPDPRCLKTAVCCAAAFDVRGSLAATTDKNANIDAVATSMPMVKVGYRLPADLPEK